MSAVMFPRGVLTDAVLFQFNASDKLSDAGVLVGDGAVPEEAGWPGGQSNIGVFVASVTLDTLEASPRDRDSVRSRHSSWACNYGLKSQGASRTQCDGTADMARNVLRGQEGELFGPGWVITNVVFTRLGPVVVNRGSDPFIYEVSDVVSVWVDRERA
ncbi:MAG: hypothetical protein ABIO67_01205 [Mycobacteriales bacterium]